jgi:hypothetical protein
MLTLFLLTIAAAQQPAAPAASPTIEEQNLAQLLGIRRICVDRLTGGETAAQIRDMIISSLQGANLYVITENPERADAFLRGSAEDLVFTDTFSSSEGINVHASLSGSDRRDSSNRRSGSASAGAGENESLRTAERKHESTASVRLVNKDGDVIWSTIQESKGGKFRGASADVADRITRQLLGDYERARKLRAGTAGPSGASRPAGKAR